MAMIECPECLTPISNKSKVCIKCGAPVVDAEVSTVPVNGVVVTEQTGKTYKGLQLLGVLIVSAGTVSCVAHDTAMSSGLWVLGIVIYVGARFGAWWNHG